MFSSAYVWAKVLGYLEEKLTSSLVSAWFDDVEVVELTEDRLVIYTPDEFRRDMISNRCTEHIESALKELFESGAKLQVLGEEEYKAFKTKEKKSSMDFNPQFTFDSFIVGPSNRMAHSASIAVAHTPGDAYNPLFLYGPPGVGKTHLLYAIANDIRKTNPDANVVYIKGDQFTIELVNAIQTKKNIEFRNKYREADLLLIDDIQFISGKEGTQEEFFHTFNALYENHKQIVMTSDRRPSDMSMLEERLRTRFEWGLIMDIQPPDYETRMAIIRTKAMSLGFMLSNDVCQYIAENVTSNVRQLEGTVKKIKAYHDLDNMPLDMEHISAVIKDMFKSEGNSVPTANLIINQVGKYYHLDEGTLKGTKRTKDVAEARHIAIYLVRTLTNLSSPEIGKEFGGRDHTTILSSITKIEDELKKGNSALENSLRDITANINSSL